MSEKKVNYRIVNLLAAVALIYLLVISMLLCWDIVKRVFELLAPFIIAFVAAYAITPFVRWLDQKGMKKGYAITMIVVGLLLFVGLLLWITLPLVYDQLSQLAKMVVKIVQNLDSNFHINLGSYQLTITDYLNGILKELGTVASSTGVDIMNKSIGLAGQAIVGLVGFIYFLIDMDKIRNAVKEWMMSISPKTYEYIKTMDKEIMNYLKGLETFMLIELVEYSLIYLIIGHPNWLIIGILACITTVIPYFGGLITNLIALILASVVSPQLLILTIIVCLVFPQLDGYFTSPKVYGKTNNINPLITIMVVSIGGSLFGVIGIIAALPVYLLLRTTYHFFKPDLLKKLQMEKK